MGLPRHRESDVLRAKPLRAEHARGNSSPDTVEEKNDTQIARESSIDLEKVRAERAGGPGLALARSHIARAFDATLAEYFDWLRSEGRGGDSNRALARRFLNVDEKQVREWRDGRKPIPLAVVLLLPPGFVEKLLARIGADREAFVRELRALEDK